MFDQQGRASHCGFIVHVLSGKTLLARFMPWPTLVWVQKNGTPHMVHLLIWARHQDLQQVTLVQEPGHDCRFGKSANMTHAQNNSCQCRLFSCENSLWPSDPLGKHIEGLHFLDMFPSHMFPTVLRVDLVSHSFLWLSTFLKSQNCGWFGMSP